MWCEMREGIVDGQRVIHAYGQNAGGYVYSFGLAREVVNLTEELLYELPAAGKLEENHTTPNAGRQCGGTTEAWLSDCS